MTLPKTKFSALSSSHLVNLFGIVSSITNATSSGPLNIGMIKKAKHEPSSGHHRNDQPRKQLIPRIKKKTSGFETTNKQI